MDSTVAAENPILNSPYAEPRRIYATDTHGDLNYKDTVETLQSFEPLAPEAVDEASLDSVRLEAYQHRVFAHLKSAGVKSGQRNKNAVFVRIDPLTTDYLHAEGYYDTAEGEQKAYIHLGPQFAPVSKAAVNEAVKACRARGDAQWLLILGFAFESDVENSVQNRRAGAFSVDKVHMHDDLLQAGLTKKDRKAATFVTIGEPDIAINPVALTPSPSPASGRGECVVVEIRGLDIYDPIKDEAKARSVADIACWTVDDDYDGASFMVRQVFFCGGDKDEFDKWQRGLSAFPIWPRRRLGRRWKTPSGSKSTKKRSTACTALSRIRFLAGPASGWRCA